MNSGKTFNTSSNNKQDDSKSNNNNIDIKLQHLVRKIIETTNSSNSSSLSSLLSCEQIVESLRTQYREYQRKDINMLKQNVQRILISLNYCNNNNKNKKRKSNDNASNNNNNSSDEDEYDRAAAEHDEIMERSAAGGGGLNASLRNRYKQQVVAIGQPPDRKNTTISKVTTDESGGEQTSITKNNNNVENNNPSSPLPPIPPQPPLSSSKRRKVKRNSISRRGSNGSIGGGSGGVEFGGTSSSELPLFMSPVSTRPIERYTDLGGMDDIIQIIRQLIEYPIKRPELYKHLGVEPPRGVLLRGPPGTGKTHLANAIAGELNVPYYRVSAPELVTGMSGESESRIRDLFTIASNTAPSIIFLDEIDAIAPKRTDSGNSRGMEKRIVAQLLLCLDTLKPINNRNNNVVMVIAATNRPDSLDSALRRAGRFDKEICLGVPDEVARINILKNMTCNMRILHTNNNNDENTNSKQEEEENISSNGFDYKLLARKTPGFVGADIKSLAKEAAVIAINRIFKNILKDDTLLHNNNNNNGDEDIVIKQNDNEESQQQKEKDNDNNNTTIIDNLIPLTKEQMEPLYVTMDDFLQAIPLVQPSSKREGFATVPDVTWTDIGALNDIREELTISVLEPIRSPEKFHTLGLPLPAGVLLFGPPGCGKTLLAKAIANESGANFISVKGPELLDKYVGESERAVRLVFDRARSSSPCVVFFDELDSLVPRRGSDHSGSGVSERVVNQLLTEMDGLDSRRSVFIIAATNRPELIDPAMMRPGRLDKLLYVPLPTPAERVSIFRALAKNVALGTDVDLEQIGTSHRANGYSGADCAALLREAGLAVMKEDAAASTTASGGVNPAIPMCILSKHFDAAFKSVLPSVSRKDQARYDRMRDRLAHARSRASVGENAADDAKAEEDSTPQPTTSS